MKNSCLVAFISSDKHGFDAYSAKNKEFGGMQPSYLTFEDLQSAPPPIFAFAVIRVKQEEHRMVLSFIHQVKTLSPQPFTQFILVTDEFSDERLDEFWQSGMISHVTHSNDNLTSAINRVIEPQLKILVLEQNLKEASDIALLSMSASSQLGEIIRFLERSYSCSGFDELGKSLNECLELMGVSGCGVIKIEGDNVYFGDIEKEEPWRRLLLQLKNEGRFIDIEDRTIVNFDNISVMARNMPSPGSEPHGRMKDQLFTLVEGAESRVKAIFNEKAAQMADQAKASFLSTMSHELRTPMNSIMGFSGRLAQKTVGHVLSARETEALRCIDQNAKQLMSLISDLLELGDISTESIPNTKRTLLRDALHEQLTLAANDAKEKDLAFNVRWQDEQITADIDIKRLQLMMKRLLSNAVTYTESGSVTVSIESVFDKTRGGDSLKIAIRDTGIGMSQEDIKRYAKPFSNIGRDYLNRGEGNSGIGLAIAVEFTNEMGGLLSASSELGKGTTFTFQVQQYDHENPDIELF